MIPKQLEKPIFYGAAIAGGLLLLSVMAKGVKGTARDVTSGIVGGAFDAVGGVVSGIVDATGSAVVEGYNALPNSVKPSSDQNIVYKGVNSIGAGITGDKNFTLGGWFYDITH